MSEPTYTAFAEQRHLTTATLPELLRVLKTHHDQHTTPTVVFQDHTGRHIDFDLRGTVSDVLARYLGEPPRPTPARPAAGATPRDVTLLPRHWDWLDEQRGGASAALRRLVDEARKRDPDAQDAARATEATRHVITAMAGHLPHFEEATRALYTRRADLFTEHTRSWPADIRAYALRLAEPVFATSPAHPA